MKTASERLAEKIATELERQFHLDSVSMQCWDHDEARQCIRMYILPVQRGIGPDSQDAAR